MQAPKTQDIARVDISRRRALALTAGLAAAARMGFPGGAHAQGAGPEVKGFKLGYIALTDAAPLIVAKEKGHFAKHGLPDMEILKQASWGALRDNLVLGGPQNGIDGAHILSPLALSHRHGEGDAKQRARANEHPRPAQL